MYSQVLQKVNRKYVFLEHLSSYLRYRIKYEVEIQFDNLSDTYKHYRSMMSMFCI